MATDVLPHNLSEIAQACIQLLRAPRTSVEDLLSIVVGPDFPTGGEIISSQEELLNAYESGRGVVRCRARYERENGDIVVSELPFQSSPSRVLEQIAIQMSSKRLPMLIDLRDESDHENPIRLVLVPRSSRVDVERLMSHLYATTDLERGYRVNFNVIGLDRRPKVMSLAELLGQWLRFRKLTVRRRIEHRISQIDRRLEIIEGLLVAHLNIDEVIRMVREEDNPKPAIMNRFGLTELQATSILDLRVRQLTRLEHEKLEAERKTLTTERVELDKILNSNQRMNTLIRKELESVVEEFGDSRRTVITVEAAEASAFTENELVPNEPVSIVLSQKGWIRSAKGHEIDPHTLSYREGDEFLCKVNARTNDQCMLFDSTGRMYSLPVLGLPSARGQGEPLTSVLAPPPNSKFVGLASSTDANLIVASNFGKGFTMSVPKNPVKVKGGKIVVVLQEGSELLSPSRVPDDGHVVLISNQGRMLVVDADSIPSRTRGMGVSLIGLSSRGQDEPDRLIHILGIGPNDSVEVTAGKRTMTLSPKKLLEYAGRRGNRGRKLPRGYTNVSGLRIA